jgi:hypothetical protein
LVPSDEQHNQIRIHLIRKFKWKRIGTIYSTKAKYTLTHNLLIRELDKMDIYTQSRSVPSESTLEKSAVYEAILNDFLKNDIKIIFGLFDMETTVKLFCEVYKKNMFGKNYQWIIIGSYDKSFFFTLKSSTSNQLNDCSIEQIVTALNGTLQTRVSEYSHNLRWKTDKSYLNELNFEIKNKVLDLQYIKVVDAYYRWFRSIPYACQSINEYFHGYAFDALISIYRVLGNMIETKNLSCDHESFERTTEWFTLVNKAFNQVSFKGVTVRLELFTCSFKCIKYHSFFVLKGKCFVQKWHSHWSNKTRAADSLHS